MPTKAQALNDSVKRSVATEISRLEGVRALVRPSETKDAARIDGEIAVLSGFYNNTLLDRIEAVREADRAYRAFNGGSDEERKAWRAKTAARTALREAIYDTLGLDIDDLQLLARG